MALPAPDLDDRRFDDLVADARRLIADHCPEWTDLSPADPGVTLIETFALMTEQLIYRLNRVPDRLYVKFLELIGVRLVPPTAATTGLTFWLSTPARSTQVVPAGTLATTATVDDTEPLVFATRADLEVPACALAHLRVAGAAETGDRTRELELGGPATSCRSASTTRCPAAPYGCGSKAGSTGSASTPPGRRCAGRRAVRPAGPPARWASTRAAG
jgi:predicted phage baseplate assembly protein